MPETRDETSHRIKISAGRDVDLEGQRPACRRPINRPMLGPFLLLAPAATQLQRLSYRRSSTTASSRDPPQVVQREEDSRCSAHLNERPDPWLLLFAITPDQADEPAREPHDRRVYRVHAMRGIQRPIAGAAEDVHLDLIPTPQSEEPERFLRTWYRPLAIFRPPVSGDRVGKHREPSASSMALFQRVLPSVR